jgi:6-pyruvoyltetrahydropterin/6-carboxytetrahydropterin synthase
VDKDYLVFCAAHFITYRGHQCESLHGHNYRLSIRIDGLVDENAYVIDFGLLKRLGRQMVAPLDHRVLLAGRNPMIAIRFDEESVETRYENRRYVFPKQDVAVLPIRNTTAEMLASNFVDQLTSFLCAEPEVDQNLIHWVEVEVEESHGQAASCRRRGR